MLNIIILLLLSVKRYEGTGKLQFINCDIQNFNFEISVGNISTLADLTSAHTAVMHLEFDQSKLVMSLINLEALTHYSFMAVRFTNSVLHDSCMWKGIQGGLVGVLVENCTTLANSDSVCPIYFVQATQVTVRNCSIGIYAKSCTHGCGVYLEGTDLLHKDLSGLKELADLLACPSETCYFTHTELIIEGTVFHGSIFTSANVVFCRNSQLKIANFTFNMTKISKE